MNVDLRGERRRLGLTLRDVSRRTTIPVDILAALEESPSVEGEPGTAVWEYRRRYVRFLGLDEDLEEPPPAPGERPQAPGRDPTETTVPQTGPWGLGPIPIGRTIAGGLVLLGVVLLGLWTLASLLGRGADEPVVARRIEAEVIEPADDPPEPVAPAAPAAPEIPSALPAPAPAVAATPEAPPETPAEPATPPEPGPPRVDVRAIEPTRVVVSVDGVIQQDGLLAKGTARFQGGREVSVYVADLTRVEVRHQGRRVRPLGNLTRPRRLVFIDDLSE